MRGEHERADYGGLPTVENMSSAAMARWVLPRAVCMPGFRNWRHEDFLQEVMVNAATHTQPQILPRVM